MSIQPSAEGSAQGPARVAGVRAAQGLALVLVLGYVVTAVPGVRSSPGFHTVLDGWLETCAYLAVAVVALLRPATVALDRHLWQLIGAAVALRALGYVLYVTLVRTQPNPPFPSIADAPWLGLYAFLIAAFVAMLRTRKRRRSLSLTVDAVLAGLTVAGISFELLFDTLNRVSTRNDPDEMVTLNLAYPILDLSLLVLATGCLIAVAWRSRSTMMLTLSVACFAVVDSTYAYQAAKGHYGSAGTLDALWLVATTGMAFSAWLPDVRFPLPERTEFSRILLPTLLGLVAIAGLLYGTIAHVPLGAVLLTAAALVLGIARAVLTLVQYRGTALTAIRATNEELVRFQALVETSEDFIAMARPDGGVMYLNPAGRRLVGVDPDHDVTAMSIADFLTEEGMRQSAEVEQPAVVADGFWSGESTLRHHGGRPPVPVAISSFLMRHPETGEPFALATVQRDISDRLAAQTALQRLADERQRLLGRLVQAQEDERARVAADVHDDSVQALAAVELRLGLMRRQLEGHDPALVRTTQALSESVSHAMDRLRHLLFDLESPAVENGLAQALELAAEHVFEDRVGWRVVGDVEVDLPESVRVTAYRIVREALVNVAKHARADAVVISVSARPDAIEVVVDDDGVGFDPTVLADLPGHIGIGGMRDRALVAGGSLTVVRRPEGGTRVRLELPVHPGDEPEGSA